MNGTLEITSVVHCINICSYCPQSLLKAKYKHESRRMTLETFKTCLDKVPITVTIDFSGYAEPFLNQQAPQMMRYAIENGYSVRLFSTLVGLSMQGLESLKGLKFHSVHLHLPDNDGHLKCDVDEKYLAVANRFKELIQIDGSHVYGVLHEKLVPIFPGTVSKKLHNEHLHTRANNVQTTKIELKAHNYLAGNIGCDVIRRKGGDILDHNVLLPNGDVTICCMDYGLEHKIGNLLTDKYEDLHASEGYKYLIEGLKADCSYDILCRTCSESYPKNG